MPASYSQLSIEELVRACAAEGDAGAWEEFIKRTHAVIAGTALKTARQWGGYNIAELEDLVQDIYLKISTNRAAILREFESKYPGAIFSYLKVIAMHAVYDHFRSASRRGHLGEPAPDSIETHADPAGASEIERRVLLSQIEGLLEENTSGPHAQRDRLIFRLYYRQGLTATAIAGIPALGLTVKGIESTIHRLTRLVRSEMVRSRTATQRPFGAGEGSRCEAPL